MKLHLKLFLILLSCIVVFVSVAYVWFIHLTQQQAETEKLDMNYGVLKQTVISFAYLSDSIERYIFDQCNAEEIASATRQTSNQSILKIQLETKIKVIGSSPYLLHGFIMDSHGRFFSDASGEEALKFEQMVESDIFDSDDDIEWLTDDEGSLYLKRNIYQILNNELVAYIVYEIDRAYLRSSVGLAWFAEGAACILDEYGNIILTTADAQDDIFLFNELINQIKSGNILPRQYWFEKAEYRVISVSGASGAWSAIYQITIHEMLANFYQLRAIMITTAIVLIALAAVISYLLAASFTANTRKLKKLIGKVHYDSEISRIPALGEDEIGELAQHFNGLLDRLDETYQAMQKDEQEKQHAKYEMLLFKYRSLQAQISPHFLCNILSSINMLSMSNKSKQVEKLAIDASRYLRENLRINDRYFNTISGEIRLARDYLKLVNVISATQIVLKAHYKRELYNTKIFSMLLQPFVENAVKHGIPPQREKPLVIDLFVQKKEGGMLELCIQDNGIGFDPSVIEEIEQLTQNSDFQPQHVGYGLVGIIRRLALQYGKDFQFQIDNREQGGAQIRILFPMHDEIPLYGGLK